MSRYQSHKDCTQRTVDLTSANGVRLVYLDKSSRNSAVCQTNVPLPSLKEVGFLRHVLSEEGTSVDPAKNSVRHGLEIPNHPN